MARTIYLDEFGTAYLDRKLQIARVCGKHRHNGDALMKTQYGYYECSKGHIVELDGKEIIKA